MSIPIFAVALLFIYVFALKFHWLPAIGYTPWTDGVFTNLKSFVLPSLSIAIIEWGPLMSSQ